MNNATPQRRADAYTAYPFTRSALLTTGLARKCEMIVFKCFTTLTSISIVISQKTAERGLMLALVSPHGGSNGAAVSVALGGPRRRLPSPTGFIKRKDGRAVLQNALLPQSQIQFAGFRHFVTI